MELFLLGNSLISLLVFFYNRYGKTNNSAKLILTSFALICWLIPFNLIRELFPQTIAVSVQWILPLKDYVVTEPLVGKSDSIFEYITLINSFIFFCMVGVLFFVVKLHQHKKWIYQLKDSLNSQPLFHYKKIPVFASPKIESALLVGYIKPEIWLNPNLINSTYQTIILQHEYTHCKNKDNYLLLFKQFIQSIYWWNPLVRILSHHFEEQLESRCDHQASQNFTENIYQQKLTELILSHSRLTSLTNLKPVAHTGFVSAVISKNSNIRRLKSLKEKQTMNTFSKIIISFILLSAISLLTFPLSTTNVMADSNNQSNKDAVSLNFKEIPVEPLAEILADVLDLKAVVADDLKGKIVSIRLDSEPQETLLATLKEQLNINFVTSGSDLLVTSLPGGVTKPTYIESDLIQTLLKINFSINNEVRLKNDLLVTNEQWTGFQSNGVRLNILATKVDDSKIFLEIKVFQLINNEYQLISSPTLMTAYNSAATIQMGEEDINNHFEGFTLTITPELI